MGLVTAREKGSGLETDSAKEMVKDSVTDLAREKDSG
jgi:hypothetical protein